jgi:hypothetical protein
LRQPLHDRSANGAGFCCQKLLTATLGEVDTRFLGPPCRTAR